MVEGNALTPLQPKFRDIFVYKYVTYQLYADFKKGL